eukprot:1424627-Pyramimonas_sp.AAC.1
MGEASRKGNNKKKSQRIWTLVFNRGCPSTGGLSQNSKKKKISLGTIVLVSVGILFVGCFEHLELFAPSPPLQGDMPELALVIKEWCGPASGPQHQKTPPP